jgi:hypothetical protein
MPRARRDPTMKQHAWHTEEAAMVGIMFLYGIWAVLAIGAIVASAMAFREHE